MSQYKWWYALVLLVFVVSHVVHHVLHPYINGYFFLAHASVPVQEDGFEESRPDLKEDKSTLVIVAIENKCISGDEARDYQKAENHLIAKSAEQFKYKGMEKHFGHHCYGFRPLVENKTVAEAK